MTQQSIKTTEFLTRRVAVKDPDGNRLPDETQVVEVQVEWPLGYSQKDLEGDDGRTPGPWSMVSDFREKYGGDINKVGRAQ